MKKKPTKGTSHDNFLTSKKKQEVLQQVGLSTHTDMAVSVNELANSADPDQSRRL